MIDLATEDIVVTIIHYYRLSLVRLLGYEILYLGRDLRKKITWNSKLLLTVNVMVTGSVDAMVPSPGIFDALPVIYFLLTAPVMGVLVAAMIDIRLQCLVMLLVCKLYILCT